LGRLTEDVVLQVRGVKMKIKMAQSDAEILCCFDTMSQLRPHLKRESFVETVRKLEADGFKLAYIEDEGEIVCVTGYRIISNLCFGKTLYIEDLVTSENLRSKSYGEKMIGWLKEVASSELCKVLHLDSGTHRARAHKFYFSQDFFISDYHFYMEL
jgi:hypothetical protein